MRDFYRGFQIVFLANGPVTGRYRAARFGVTLGAGSWDELKRMIDLRLADQHARQPEVV